MAGYGTGAVFGSAVFGQSRFGRRPYIYETRRRVFVMKLDVYAPPGYNRMTNSYSAAGHYYSKKMI